MAVGPSTGAQWPSPKKRTVFPSPASVNCQQIISKGLHLESPSPHPRHVKNWLDLCEMFITSVESSEFSILSQ